MRPRRTSFEPEEIPWSEGYEASPEPVFDETVLPARSRAAGPIRFCLACGETPARGGDCRHDEVATLEAPGAALRDAAALLERLSHERRAAARALRRLVDPEVLAGAAVIERHESPPLSPAAVTPQAPEAKRARRRGAVAETQGAFDFAAAVAGGEVSPRRP